MNQSTTANSTTKLTTTSAPELETLLADFSRDGYVVVSGLFDDTELAALESSLEGLQRGIADGFVDRAKHGGDYLTSVAPGETASFVNYVKDVTRLSTEAHDVFHHPLLIELLRRCFDGVEPWEFDEEHGSRFGVVYQDARPGQESAYTRIGWHSDHQAFPNSDFFPSIALTVHLDATSPANGFLRVVPGSHLWETDGMPLGFEKIAGEVAVYCDRGDVILHHCDLWHSAARATEDAPGGVRRHMRGSWCAGRQPEPGEILEEFNKNAAR
jgi:ectoine hydroxylase-related dioxygenase (phytanoyl-CoA dioxygenase family)